MDLEVMSRRQGQTGDFLRTDFNHREILDVSHNQRSGHCTFKQCFLFNSLAPCRSTSCLAISSKFQRIEYQCRRWPGVRDRSTIPEHFTIEFCGSRASRHRKIFSHNTHDHEACSWKLRLSSCIIFILLLSDFLGTYLSTREKSDTSHKRLWRLCTFDYLCIPRVIIPLFWSILANCSVWWSWQL